MCKRIVATVLLLFWMCVIFGFSAQPAEASSALSGKVREIVIEIAEKIMPSLSDSMTDEAEGKGILTTIIRKTAHFSCYLVLGLFAMWTASCYGLKRKWQISILFCVLYAVSDEVHQLFVPGRAGKPVDVLIDTIGSLVGILFFIFLRNKRKNKALKK